MKTWGTTALAVSPLPDKTMEIFMETLLGYIENKEVIGDSLMASLMVN